MSSSRPQSSRSRSSPTTVTSRSIANSTRTRQPLASPPPYSLSDSSEDRESDTWSTDADHNESDDHQLLNRDTKDVDEEEYVGLERKRNKTKTKPKKVDKTNQSKNKSTEKAEPSLTTVSSNLKKSPRWCTPKIAILSTITTVIIIVMCIIAGYLIHTEMKQDYPEHLNATLSALEASTRSTALMAQLTNTVVQHQELQPTMKSAVITTTMTQRDEDEDD
ncbi:hypothetical protein OIO90_006106 [Microbotryomycetes sp. JL221]|nr:hypothetical protein OIO90_006106 [Microbotryomycetes sp. JL221]